MDYIPKNWKSIYPLYVDKAFSKNNGRKTDVNSSCENPTVEEISQVLAFLKIPHAIEPHKRHPSDFPRFGRVKYSLHDDQSQLVNTEITSKTVLYKKIGSMIPKLKSRTEEASSSQRQFVRRR